MRIAVLNITSGGMSGGYKKYLKTLVPKLVVHPEVSEILLILPDTITIPGLCQEKLSIQWAKMNSNYFVNKENKNDIIKKVEKFSPDVIYIPTARFLKINSVPTVNMVRNMEPVAYSGVGNPVMERIKNVARELIAKQAVRNSDRVIAVSKYVKEYITAQWGIPGEKIGVVCHGIDIPPEKDIMIKPTSVLAHRENGFLFTAGSIRPARGLEDIIRALGILKQAHGLSINLLVAGKPDPYNANYYKKLKRLISKNKCDGNISWAGELDEKEMAWCYKKCLAFIMTSRVEACPNTALEAMSHGCITIAADNPPLPEIFDNAATFYKQCSEKDLAVKISKVMSWDKQKKESALNTAKQRALFYSWDKTAQQTVNELVKAVDGKNKKNI